MIAAIFVLAAALTPAADSALAWHGITLGAPASTLRPLLGDPLRIVPVNGRRVARYWLPGAGSTYVLVVEDGGYISSFEAFSDVAPTAVLDNVAPDPSGVRLGDTLEAVKSAHPDYHSAIDPDDRPLLAVRISPTTNVGYTFDNGRLRSFQWTTTAHAAQPALPPLAAPTGDSLFAAILDKQADETDGVAWEYRYLAFHPCSGDTRWQLKTQSLMHEAGHAYDRLHVICPATNAERDFYFDITSFFGKL
ncbi:MAG TPA: hypothetical protein VIW73_10215 [Candidatus Cybelea sp.]